MMDAVNVSPEARHVGSTIFKNALLNTTKVNLLYNLVVRRTR